MQGIAARAARGQASSEIAHRFASVFPKVGLSGYRVILETDERARREEEGGRAKL